MSEKALDGSTVKCGVNAREAYPCTGDKVQADGTPSPPVQVFTEGVLDPITLFV